MHSSHHCIAFPQDRCKTCVALKLSLQPANVLVNNSSVINEFELSYCLCFNAYNRFNSEFFSFGTVGILSWIILCCGSILRDYGMFTSTSDSTQ